jgi:hypothetical protein
LTHACQQLSNNVQKCNACRMGEKASDVLHLSRKAAFQTAKWPEVSRLSRTVHWSKKSARRIGRSRPSEETTPRSSHCASLQQKKPTSARDTSQSPFCARRPSKRKTKELLCCATKFAGHADGNPWIGPSLSTCESSKCGSAVWGIQ